MLLFLPNGIVMITSKVNGKIQPHAVFAARGFPNPINRLG
jgi:hypothetical protein